MKRTTMFAFVAMMLASVGCRSASEPVREAPPSVSEARPSCSQVGGTCRKSACRTNETLEHFQCGTDAACCVPAP